MAGKFMDEVVIPFSSSGRAKPRDVSAPESASRRKRPVKSKPRGTTGAHRKRGWLWCEVPSS